MAIRSSGSSDKSSANLAIIIGVGVVVLIILVAVIVHSRSTQSSGVAALTTGDPNAAYVLQKAKECKGDIRALSQDDQTKLSGMYGGYGAATEIARVYRASTGQ